MADASEGLLARIARALFGPAPAAGDAAGPPSIPPDSLRPTLDDAPMSGEDVMIAAVATEPLQPSGVGLSSVDDAAGPPPVHPAVLQAPHVPPPTTGPDRN